MTYQLPPSLAFPHPYVLSAEQRGSGAMKAGLHKDSVIAVAIPQLICVCCVTVAYLIGTFNSVESLT